MGQSASDAQGSAASGAGSVADSNTRRSAPSLFRARSFNLLNAGFQYEQRDLLDAALKKSNGKKVIDRADFRKLLDFQHERFIKLDDYTAEVKVALSKDGEIERIANDAEGRKAWYDDKTLWKFGVPSFSTTDLDGLVLRGGGKVFTICVNSDQLIYLPPIMKRCESVGDIATEILRVLGAGAETVNLTICHQMLECMYDKVDVAQLMGDRPNGKERKRTWIMTSYLWVTMHHYTFIPVKDVLQGYLKEYRESKTASREHIIRKMRTEGNAQKHMIELFLEGTGGKTVGPKTDKYLRIMADQAKERKFEVVRLDNIPDLPKPGQTVAPRKLDGKTPGESGTVDQCLDWIVKQIKTDSANPVEWTLLIGWEPLQVLRVDEALHEAQRAKVASDEQGYVRNVMRAVALIGKKNKMKEQSDQHADTKGKNDEDFNEREVDAVLSANKSELDHMIKDLEQGMIDRSRFEKHFERECDHMISFVDSFLLPMAIEENNAKRIILCKRTKADFLRYLHVWVPSRRERVHEAIRLYQEAMEESLKLERQRDLVFLTSCVNFAVFQGEVERRNDLAAQVCRKNLANCGNDAELTRHEFAPSEIFNYNLIVHNLAAFESEVAILFLTFVSDGMAKHCEIEKRPLDQDWVEPHEDHDRNSMGSWLYNEGESERVGQDQWGQVAMCMGMRNRLCLDRNLNKIPPPGRDPSHRKSSSSRPQRGDSSPKSSQAKKLTPQARAVYRWLRGTPFFKLHDAAARAELLGDDEPDKIAEIRWVKAVDDKDSVIGTMEELDSSSEEEGTDNIKQQKQQDQSIDNAIRRLQRNVRAESKTDEELHSFVLACVVRLSDGNIGDGRSRALDAEWLKELRDGLMKEPPRRSDKQREVVITAQDDMDQVLNIVDKGGTVVRQCHIQGGSEILYPGEVMIVDEKHSEDCGGGGITEMLDEMKKCDSFPYTLKFLQSLQVKSVDFLARAAYTDMHEHFTGFKEVQGGIHLAKPHGKQALRLRDLAKEMRAETSTGAHGGKIAPRRMRNLSARRNPMTAGTRGCQ